MRFPLGGNMPIEVACGKCGAKLRAPDNAAGRTAKCPKCGSPITVPSPVVEAELIEEVSQPSAATSGFQVSDEYRSAYRPPAPEPQTAGPASSAPAAGNLGDEFGMRMLLPVGRSWLAIVAGYLGLFSVLACPAPIALVFGILAMLDIRKHPQKHGMGRAIFGLVMGLLGTIALAIFVVEALINGLHSGRR
jgi:Domain of unknown function (DUF4190)